MRSRTVEMVPFERATLSPREFVELPEEARKALKRVAIEPPRLGTRGFGRFLVEFRYPVFRSAQHVKRAPVAGASR